MLTVGNVSNGGRFRICGFLNQEARWHLDVFPKAELGETSSRRREERGIMGGSRAPFMSKTWGPRHPERPRSIPGRRLLLASRFVESGIAELEATWEEGKERKQSRCG